MITLRTSQSRGRSHFDWLDSRHSFSFGEYYDPEHMGFRGLRVINDDLIGGGGGFGMHPHRDMEIISYISRGALQHRDSMGNGSVVTAGEAQFMGAGTGVMHSEFNPSETEEMRLLQIWIVPERRGLAPAYAQRRVFEDGRRGAALIASRDGRDGSMPIRADAAITVVRLAPGERHEAILNPARGYWVQVVSGSLDGAGHALADGDALSLEGEQSLSLTAKSDAEFLLFDLA